MPSLASSSGWLLLAAVLGPLLLALAYAAAQRWSGPWLAVPAALLAAGEAALLAILHLRGEAVVELAIPWMPAIGVELALRLDALSFVLAELVAIVGLAVLVFAARYLPHDLEERAFPRSAASFFAMLLLFFGSMLGLVLADDWITFYVFWELTSIASFLLIGIDQGSRASLAGALKALVITGAGGVLLLVGLVGLEVLAEEPAVHALAEVAPAVMAHPAGWIVLTCFALAAFAKSAQVPFHGWLPDAMVAPTPVSAYLHSATLVTAGVILLVRTAPLFAASRAGADLLVSVGAVTMVFAAMAALGGDRLKRILAYSTISQHGYMVVLLGLGAVGAAVFFLVVHAFFKAGLFLCAGIITRATGEDRIHHLHGLWRTHPFTGAATLVLGMALAGLPLVSGFWSKELYLAAVVESSEPWLVGASLVGSTLTLVYALRFSLLPLLGPEPPRVEVRERGMFVLLAPAVALAVVALLAGLMPHLFAIFTDPAAAAAVASPGETDLELHWPPTPALTLSLIAFGSGGLALAWVITRDRRLRARPEGADEGTAARMGWVLARVGPDALYDRGLPLLDVVSRGLARVQTGIVLHYMLLLVLVPVALGAVLLPAIPSWPGARSEAPLAGGATALAALSAMVSVLAIGSTIVRSQLAAVIQVTAVGFLLAVFFAVLRAPDVSLVQVTVETLLAILLVLLLGRVRTAVRREVVSTARDRSPMSRLLLAGVCAVVGGLLGAIQLLLDGLPADPRVGRFYLDEAAASGVDAVVTAVLVDFRALDTLGEVVVFSIAVIAAMQLLGRWRDGSHPADGSQVREYSDLVRTTARIVFPSLLVFAASQIANAHDDPGEGFSAGMLVALSVLLLFVSVGRLETERELPHLVKQVFPAGLVLLVLVAALGPLQGEALLRHWTRDVAVLGSTLHLSTTVLLDLAIFLVIAGGTHRLLREIVP